MKRRALLATAAGTAGALGTTGCLQGLDGAARRLGSTTDDSTTGADDSRDGTQTAFEADPRDAGEADEDWKSGVEPVESFETGDRDAVAFPDGNQPHRVHLWNRVDEERDVSLAVLDTFHMDRNPLGVVAVPGDAVVAIQLNRPGRYAIEVGVDDTEFGTAVVERTRFDCNHSVGRYALGEQDLVDYGGETTLVACTEPAVASTDLAVVSRDCGSESDERAGVRYGDGSVVLHGSFVSGSSCNHLSLATADYDEKTRRLRVVVDADPQDEDGCVNCVGVIEYDATVGVENDFPDHVELVHRRVDGEARVVERAAQSIDD